MRAGMFYVLPAAGLLAVAGCEHAQGTSGTETIAEEQRAAQERADEQQHAAQEARLAEQQAEQARQEADERAQAAERQEQEAAQRARVAEQQAERARQQADQAQPSGHQVISSVTGRVAWVSTDQLQLREGSGRSTTFQLEPQTSVTIDGRQASIAEVQQGADARVSYDWSSGQRIADQIEVHNAQTGTGAGQ